MKEFYIIRLHDRDDHNTLMTICKSSQELSDLLTHVNKDKYLIIDIETVSNSQLLENHQELYVTNDEIEKG